MPRLLGSPPQNTGSCPIASPCTSGSTEPTSFGPRPAIWITVGVEVFCAVVFALTNGALGTAPKSRSHALGMDLFGLCILAMLANMQVMIIQAAKSLPHQRLEMPRFVISLIAFMAAAIICAVLF